jgi:hypothetical protein
LSKPPGEIVTMEIVTMEMGAVIETHNRCAARLADES